LKAKSPPKELYFEGVMVLTNATKYFPNIPHTASSSFHVELWAMPTFQKSTYLDSPKLINFSLLTHFNASLPKLNDVKQSLELQ